MRTARLGRTGLEVSDIGLGAMFIGTPEPEGPRNMNEDLAAETVVAAIEAGSTLIDTAPIYGAS
jgi:aryl-alcohol dehydrogenase-like predicted oxidoreductase